jgi:hypothetical protein
MKSTMSRDKELRGLEIFDIHPVILGGSATNIANKTALTRSQHIQAVRYWNQETPLNSVMIDLSRDLALLS